MKNFTLLTFIALLALPMQAQTIFESGFEDWTGNAPDGWLGIRTAVGFADSVSQVSTNPHTGNFAVRLQNRLPLTGDHRRFTTQPMTVDSGETYTVSFWARGFGDVRLGVFDGRPGNGYSPYTGYTTIANGETWQQYELTRTAATDTTLAEFIFSVKATIAPDHLIIDDVNISSGAVQTFTSIQAIQESQAPDGASPLVGQNVSTGGVVTALAANGFFIQNGGGPWSGIFVFSTQNVPAVGDSIRFSASVVEFDFPGFEPLKETQLSNVSEFLVVNSGNALVTTPVSTAAANTESFEGVLVRVNNATCTNPSAGFGQFVVNDGSGDCFVDDLLYVYTPMLNAIYNITGPVRYANQEYKILPRNAGDVEVSTSVAEQHFADVSIYPNPASENITVSGIRSNSTFVIRDAAGREVSSGSLLSMQNDLAVGQLSTGLYIITLNTNGAQWSTRFNVAR